MQTVEKLALTPNDKLSLTIEEEKAILEYLKESFEERGVPSFPTYSGLICECLGSAVIKLQLKQDKRERERAYTE